MRQIEPLDSSQISVVVQGALQKKYIFRCLASIRAVLPHAEIIVSTWREDGELAQAIDGVKVILSDDPGGTLLNKESAKENNINRELTSTQRGLASATREYALKFRSDMLLTTNAFLQEYFRVAQQQGRYFKQKILICDYYTRNPRVLPLPFHPSDWLAFGLTEDLRNYFQSPWQKRADMMWYQVHQNQAPIFRNVFARFTPEQYILLSFLAKYRKVHVKNYFDASKQNIILTEKVFAEDFIVTDIKKTGFQFLKYNPNRYWESMTLLHAKDWRMLYHHYCNAENGDKFRWQLYQCKCAMNRWLFFYGRGFLRFCISCLGLRRFIKHRIEGRTE